MKKNALFFLVISVLLGICSCSIYQDGAGDTSQDAVIDESINISTAKPNVSDDVAGELPDDIENPPQRLEVKLKSNGNDDSYYIITGIGSCTDDDLVIPSAIEGVPVSEISSDAFCNNNQIKSVFCGSRVTKIGDRAFLNCTNLKKVTVPDSVIKIGKEAFECCAVSELVLSNRITEIGESAFQLCLNLKSVKLPESLTAISDNTFNGCSNLTTVELSSMTESIGYQAFGGTGISSISIPKSVQTISAGAFNGTKIERFDVDEDNVCFCSIDGCLFSKDKTELLIYPRGRQGEYVVPDGVTQIAENAFFNCNNITLPSSLRSISSAAFVTGSNSLTVNINTGLEYICEYAFVTPGSGNPVIINFDGTKEEWNSIDKSDKWYHPYFSIGKQRVIVECNDGPLSYSFED